MSDTLDKNNEDIAAKLDKEKLARTSLDKASPRRSELRAETEIELLQHPFATPTQAMPAEKMLHELQVHQIELEMQNEELRRAYVALEESRDRYLDLFEFAPVGYLTLNASGLIEEINLSGAALLGIERKKLLLQPFTRYLEHKSADSYHLHMSRFHEQYESQSYELQLHRDDGSLCYVRTDVSAQENKEGDLIAHITLSDITKQRCAEKALQESEFRWKFAIEGSGFGVWDTNLQTDETTYSKRWKEMLGYTENETPPLHHVWLDHIHPEDVHHVQLNLQTYLSGISDNFSVEFRMQCKNGSYKWILGRGMIVNRSEDGKPLRMIGTHADITERKQDEHQLRIAAIAFEVQEGIMVTDKRGTILRTNKAFTHFTGYSADEVLGKPASILKSGRHDTSFYERLWATVSRDGYWQGEIWDKRKNGEIFPALMTITAVANAKGSITNFVGSFSDITLQKQAEALLLDARKHLERTVEKTAIELVDAKGECEEVNTALKVMIKMRRTENFEAKNLIALELKQEVLPFLAKLKIGNNDQRQMRLINTLEANLQRLISTYGTGGNTIISHDLTPKEIQIATMVREGFSTKVIAATLALSPETISIHRKNIRKKLGLGNKSENLRSHLISKGKF